MNWWRDLLGACGYGLTRKERLEAEARLDEGREALRAFLREHMGLVVCGECRGKPYRGRCKACGQRPEGAPIPPPNEEIRDGCMIWIAFAGLLGLLGL